MLQYGVSLLTAYRYVYTIFLNSWNLFCEGKLSGSFYTAAVRTLYVNATVWFPPEYRLSRKSAHVSKYQDLFTNYLSESCWVHSREGQLREFTFSQSWAFSYGTSSPFPGQHVLLVPWGDGASGTFFLSLGAWRTNLPLQKFKGSSQPSTLYAWVKHKGTE